MNTIDIYPKNYAFRLSNNYAKHKEAYWCQIEIRVPVQAA